MSGAQQPSDDDTVELPEQVVEQMNSDRVDHVEADIAAASAKQTGGYCIDFFGDFGGRGRIDMDRDTAESLYCQLKRIFEGYDGGS